MNIYRSNKNIFMDYQRSEPARIFKPQKRLDELISQNKNLLTDLIVARKMAEKNNCSFVIYALFGFALRDLFVIRNTHSGMISANFILPMAFRVDKEQTGAKGEFAIPLKEPVTLEQEGKDLLDVIVSQINTV